MHKSSLIRAFAQVDTEGRIALPKNVLVAMGLMEEDLVELKITTTGAAKKLTLSKRRNAHGSRC